MMGSLNKAVGAGVGAALGTLAIYFIELLGHVDLPSSVEGAITILLTVGVTYLSPSNAPTAEAVKQAVVTDASVAVAAQEGLAAQARAADPTRTGPLR